MRIGLSIAFMALIAILIVCVFLAWRSNKPIGKSVALLVLSLIPPILGNLFIISSPVRDLSIAGCYIYFIGMNFVMVALINFIFEYCNLKYGKLTKSILYTILALDTIQILLNTITGHVFGIELINVYGSDYYRFVPYFGQTIHRVVDYVILGGTLIVLIYKAINVSRVYAEKYLVILLAMLAVGAFGKDAENGCELTNNADHAMYSTKFNGKCGFTLFKKR